jgi:hypothetical protein
MGQVIDHADRASRNEQTLRCLLDHNQHHEHGEWIVPIACFKAIHLIEAYCAANGHHFCSHEDRLAYLKRHQEFSQEDQNGEIAYDSFHFLTMLGQHAMDIHNGLVARPTDELKKFFEGCLVRDVLDKHLRKIETFANHHGVPAIAE